MTLEMTPVDMPPEEPDETQSTKDDAPDQCVVCGEGLVYGGRGPRPKYCPDHRKSGARKDGEPSVRRDARWKEPLRNALMGNIAGIGIMVSIVDAYDGQVIIAGSDKLSKSLVDVAEKNHKVRKGLEAFTTASAWAGVATAVLAIAVPIAAHHGYLPESVMKNFGA